jgi:hypothetical protein
MIFSSSTVGIWSEHLYTLLSCSKGIMPTRTFIIATPLISYSHAAERRFYILFKQLPTDPSAMTTRVSGLIRIP